MKTINFKDKSYTPSTLLRILLQTNKSIFLTGAGGCVDRDTEYLTPNGWKKICDYQEGDLVAEYHHGHSNDTLMSLGCRDGDIAFKKPQDYIEEPCEYLTRLKTSTVDMVLSDEHKVPYITSKQNRASKTFVEILKLSKVKIPRYFKLSEETDKSLGLNLSKAYIKVLIMQSADGYRVEKKTKGVKFFINVKKEKKKIRVIKLLKRAKIPYRIYKSGEGYIKVAYYPPKEISQKGLSVLWGANKKQLKFIRKEIIFWDGSTSARKNVTTNRFTGNYKDCEFAQYCFSIVSGNYVTMSEDDRPEKYKSKVYDVTESSRDISVIEIRRSIREGQAEEDFLNPYKTLDGKMYCFTTSSGYWLARRNGKIFPTGNSGKSFLVKQVKGSYKNPLMLGSTNQSANHIGGQTVQDFFRLFDSLTRGQLQSREDVRLNKLREKHPLMKRDDLLQVLYSKERKILLKTDLIVVDEISILSKEVFNLMMFQLKKFVPDRFYEIPIMLVGDFYQLKPVKGDYAFKSTYFNDFKVIELNEVKRTKSKTFIEALHDIRKGGSTNKTREVLKFFEDNYKTKSAKDLTELEDNSIWLYATNKEVEAHNQKKMSELEGTEYMEECHTTYEDKDLQSWETATFIRDSQFEEKFYFKVGARCIFISNDTIKKKYYNGLQGTIIGYKRDDDLNYIIKVKTDEDEIIDIEKAPFQKVNYLIEGGRVKAKTVLEIYQLPLKMAYAVTVHKSQGQSISGGVVIDATRVFNPHQFYVALSRAVEPKKLCVKNLLISKHIKVDVEVKAFYNRVSKESQVWVGY